MADPRDPINTARQTLATARNLLVAALDDVAVKEAARDEARRRFAEGTQERADAERLATEAAANLLARQNDERARRDDVRTAITTWLTAAGGTTDLARATADIARVPTNIPIVLFPVRIETRFDLTSTQRVLKVRIYPDEIWINQHERALTRAEVEAAKQYFINKEITGNEQEQWRRDRDEDVARARRLRAARDAADFRFGIERRRRRHIRDRRERGRRRRHALSRRHPVPF